MTFMPSGATRSMRMPPIEPRPIRPKVLPDSSIPLAEALSQCPSRMRASSSAVWRATLNIRAKASSATDWALAPTAIETGMQRSAAAWMSMVL
ncbi:hypothetical protein D3C76_1459600 [compost metagenome]